MADTNEEVVAKGEYGYKSFDYTTNWYNEAILY